LLAACLGLHLSARDNEAFLRNPILPEKLDGLTLRNLGIGTGRVDLRVERHGSGAAVSVLRKSNDMQVLVQA
jgi:hypothetical protein